MNTRMPGRKRRRCNAHLIRLCLICFLALLSAKGCKGDPLLGSTELEERSLDMSQLLEEQLEQGDGNAVETAEKGGPSVIPILRKYVQSESHRQRALSLECFARIGGEETVQTLVRGLEDPHIKVRYKAVKLLHRTHGPSAVPKLQELVSASSDEWVRGNAALILGRLDDAASVPIIEKQIEVESHPPAVKQMTLAIARLEDGEARRKALDSLSDPVPLVRYDAIADFEYMNRPALTNRLVPLFDDTREVKNIGPEPYPVLHRVCDRAVDAVAVLKPGKLSFSVGGRTYTRDEIDEARRVIQGR